MRLPLTFIVLVLTLVDHSAIAHPADVSDPFHRTASLLHKRSLVEDASELAKNSGSWSSFRLSSKSDNGIELESLSGSSTEDEFDFAHPYSSTMDDPREHVEPLIFGRRRTSEAFRPQSKERVREHTAGLEDALRHAGDNEEAKAVILRNLKHLEAERLSPEDLAPVHGQPAWVIANYHESWVEAGFESGFMVALGEALGITEHEINGVKPITAEAFEKLQQLQESGSVRYTPTKVQEMMEWYQKANMVSLSSEEQEIFAFNLAHSQTRPWWTVAHLAEWQRRSMPWKPLAQVGTLLKLGDSEPVAPDEIIAVRRSILHILDRFSAFNNIEREIDHINPLALGNLAEMLQRASPLPLSKSKFLTDFDVKFSSIAGDAEERAEIQLQILQGDLRDIEDEKLQDLFRMHLLINGVPTEKAPGFAKALKYVKASSIIKLTKGEAETIEYLKEFFPTIYGGNIFPITTYHGLEKAFGDVLADNVLKSSTFKAIVASQMRYTGMKFRGFFSRIGSFLKKLYVSIIN